ncbi:MAG: SPFH domain-containing protein [Nanoarchaeota archaeon]|nr:SPFH domain-containing protein [Nanoarchaeota archaeon]
MEKTIDLNTKWLKRGILFTAMAVASIILITGMFGINNAGYYSIVQYPWGTINVVTTPGWYTQFFGKVTVYHKEGTYAFILPTKADLETKQEVPATKDEELSSVATQALPVRYNDGGTGHIYGKARFRMPGENQDILKIHYAFRSYEHLVDALYKVTTQNIMNLTASLMSSEESYTTTKEKFQRWAEDQMVFGPYETDTLRVKVEGHTGKTEEIEKATIKYGQDGKVLHGKSPFADYKITVTQVQVTNWTYEPKTLDQIQNKRTALMAIVQAKAEAEKALQEKITAEAKGLANVMTAKYEREVEKTKEMVDAEKVKAVAVIEATKTVEVNKQRLEATKLDRATAEQEKMATIERGRGDAEARKLKMEADNALEQKLKAYVEVNKNYADAIARYTGQWVPSIVMGQKDGKTGTGAQELIDLLTAKTAKDIGLDLTVPNKKK